MNVRLASAFKSVRRLLPIFAIWLAVYRMGIRFSGPWSAPRRDDD